MAAYRYVRVELRHVRGEALAVLVGVEDDRPIGDEQRPCLHEVARRPRRASRTLDQPYCSVVDDDGAAQGAIRPGDRLMAGGPPLHPQLSERSVRVTQEEAPDDGLPEAV